MFRMPLVTFEETDSSFFKSLSTIENLFLKFIVVIILLVSSHGALAKDPIYTLGAGDKLRVTVFEEKDLSGEFEVTGEGDISLPLIGSISAVGKNIRRLERDVEKKLLDGFLKNPRVSIDVMNYRPFYILGEVNEPGSYSYVNGMTILNAVALGGGFTYRANQKKITIIRGNDSTQTPQTINPTEVVLPGDVVRVEERFF